MTTRISERSCEEEIECGVLQDGPDVCAGDASAVRDFFMRSGPGTVKLTPESAKEFIRTRFTTPPG